MISRSIVNIIKKTKRYILSPFIIKDLFKYRKTNGSKRFSVKAKDFYPCIRDKTMTTGFDRHYVYHTAWAARVVREIVEKDAKFKKHVDISSSLYFSGIVSAFVPVEFYDYRPAKLELDNYKSLEGNLLNLPFKDKSVLSLSCMHTLEHIGLGRYGDEIDAEGDLKAIRELKRVVSLNGNLLIVLPIGRPHIEFNAHRVYSYEQVLKYFTEEGEKDFTLKEFTLIPEKEIDGPMVRNANPERVRRSNYDCGCFWFVRNKNG